MASLEVAPVERDGGGPLCGRGVETSGIRGLSPFLVLNRGALWNDSMGARRPQAFGVQCHGSLVNRVSGLDGSSFHGPLCCVGVSSARGVRGDVRQVGDGDIDRRVESWIVVFVWSR